MWTDAELAWAVGILEGEGTFSIFKSARCVGPRRVISVQCAMSDEDIILRMKSIFNVGTIYKSQSPIIRKDGSLRKPIWTWTVTNFKDQQFILEIVLPYLGKRRTAKVKELLEYIYGRTN